MTAQAGGTTSSLAARKDALRRQLRQARAALPAPERRRAAQAAARHLARACRRWQVQDVAVYLGMAEELDTAPLLRALAGLRLYAPKVGADHRLHFARLWPRAALLRKRYDIREPARRCHPARLDLVVVPLVGFDAHGARLGMGGGYYDRRLAGPRPFRRPLRVGYGYALQETGRVPAGPHDVRLDAVVTERGLRRFS